MRKAKKGNIVVVGSLTATDPHAGLGAYVIFKNAVTMLVRTIAVENGDANITANAILPGTMDTPANRAAMPNSDFSKWLKLDDAANLIAWLASDDSSQVSGALIPIEGH